MPTASSRTGAAPQRYSPQPFPPPEAALSGHPSAPLRERRRSEPADEADADPAPAPRSRRVAGWLTVAALLLALWSASTFVDSANFVIAGMAAISPLIAVFALPVIAVGVASKHLVPTVIAVAAALLPWSLVIGYASAGPGPTAIGTNKTLRVMSVDGAQGRANAQDIVQAARNYSVDVVVVTQLTSGLAHQLTVAGLNTFATAQWVQVPAGGVNGTGVWSAPKIDGLAPIDALSRPGVDGSIEAGQNQGQVGITVVQLAGEPLRPGTSSWHADLARLAHRTPPTTPGFIVGNLNATPWQPAFRALTAAGWRDAADVVGQGLRPTWPSWSPLPISPLDHVLVSKGLGVNSAETTNIAGSGHRALIVTMVLPHTAG